MKLKNSDLFGKFILYGLKQPGIYLLMTTGILLDFIIQSPFIVICSIENLFRKKAL